MNKTVPSSTPQLEVRYGPGRCCFSRAPVMVRQSLHDVGENHHIFDNKQ